MISRNIASISVLVFTLFASGCTGDRMSEVGFSMPRGDASAGREAFLVLQCHECHTVAGDDLPTNSLAEPAYVELGGDTTEIKTYGQLVTAIINPSHDLADGYPTEAVSENGESKMRNYNDYLTVRQLSDIVMYLQPHYRVIFPGYPLAPHI